MAQTFCEKIPLHRQLADLLIQRHHLSLGCGLIAMGCALVCRKQTRRPVQQRFLPGMGRMIKTEAPFPAFFAAADVLEGCSPTRRLLSGTMPNAPRLRPAPPDEIADLLSFGKVNADIPKALSATPADTARDPRDAKRDQAMTAKALNILTTGGADAYAPALSALREDTRSYWVECLDDPPTDGLRYQATAEDLAAWI